MFDLSTRNVISAIAKRIKVSPAALLAIAEVEAAGRTSAPVRGRREPLIRFEGHYFDRLLKGAKRTKARRAGLAHPSAGKVKNPRGQSRRWDLLDKAIEIDRIAALSSCSWGLGQVMGSHWKWLGYGSVDALVSEARRGVAGQVELMARFVEKSGLDDELRRLDWAGFARRYNGPAYKRNRYDQKMRDAYKRYSKMEDTPVLPQPDKVSDERGTLRFGSHGPAVRRLQSGLAARGYLISVDGIFGLKTDAVMRQFQAASRLPETGVFGAQEEALLFKPRHNKPVAKPGWFVKFLRLIGGTNTAVHKGRDKL
ncbi:MAG: N-acetylmuramidase domain-containing protein [Ahrensia sp.]|nr:N-acetylmuramidase domain-containing protein [Ahrensia sp.]